MHAGRGINAAMLTAHEIRALAVEARVDPRTVTRWLAGLQGTAESEARLVAAAAKLGIFRSPVAVSSVKPPTA